MARLLMVTPDNEEVEVEEKDAESAIQNGLEPALEYVDKQGQVNVVRRRDQKAAEDAGLKQKVIYDAEQQVAGDVRQPGKVESAARGFANAGTFGFADEIGGAGQALLKAFQKGTLDDVKKDYVSERDRYRKEDDAAYKNNKLLYGAGAIAPTVATLGTAVPAMTVGRAAVQGAGLGGLASAGGGTDAEGQADLTKGEVGRFAGQVGTGAALGGAIGAGVQKASNALLNSPENLKTFASQRAAKAAGGDSAKATRVTERLPGGTEDFGQDLLQSGIVSAGKNRQQILEKASEVERQSGQRIGEILSSFDEFAKGKGYTPTTLSRVLERSQQEVLNPLQESPATQELGDRLVSKYLGKLKEFVEKNEKQGKALSFKDLAKERRLLDKTAFTETGLDKPLNEKLQAIRRIFNEEILKDASQVAPPEALTDLARQNRLFSVATTAKKLTKEQLDRGQKNRSVSLTDYITGGTAGAAGAAAAGPAGLVLAPIGAALNKVGRERGNQVLAAGAQKASATMGQLLKDPAKLRQYLDTLRRGLSQKGGQ
jgi:hypothetical protein